MAHLNVRQCIPRTPAGDKPVDVYGYFGGAGWEYPGDAGVARSRRLESSGRRPQRRVHHWYASRWAVSPDRKYAHELTLRLLLTPCWVLSVPLLSFTLLLNSLKSPTSINDFSRGLNVRQMTPSGRIVYFALKNYILRVLCVLKQPNATGFLKFYKTWSWKFNVTKKALCACWIWHILHKHDEKSGWLEKTSSLW